MPVHLGDADHCSSSRVMQTCRLTLAEEVASQVAARIQLLCPDSRLPSRKRVRLCHLPGAAEQNQWGNGVQFDVQAMSSRIAPKTRSHEAAWNNQGPGVGDVRTKAREMCSSTPLGAKSPAGFLIAETEQQIQQ